MALMGILGFTQVLVNQRTQQFPLETGAGMEVVHFIIQHMCIGQQDAWQRRSMRPGLQPVFNPSAFAPVFPLMLRWMQRWTQRLSCLSMWLGSQLVFHSCLYSTLCTSPPEQPCGPTPVWISTCSWLVCLNAAARLVFNLPKFSHTAPPFPALAIGGHSNLIQDTGTQVHPTSRTWSNLTVDTLAGPLCSDDDHKYTLTISYAFDVLSLHITPKTLYLKRITITESHLGDL